MTFTVGTVRPILGDRPIAQPAIAPHTVLTGGRPVLAAGEAEIATGGGRRLGIEITNYSGHYLPSGASLQIGRSAFEVAGIVFP